MLIEAVDFHYTSEPDSQVPTVVEFRSAQATISVCCWAGPPHGATQKQRVLLDAIRQLRRMPEFRSGAKRFRFADGAFS